MFRVFHTGGDGWTGQYVRIFFDDNSYLTCKPNPTIYIQGAGSWNSNIELDDDQWADVPCF